jgi:hypothetical protein
MYKDLKQVVMEPLQIFHLSINVFKCGKEFCNISFLEIQIL